MISDDINIGEHFKHCRRYLQSSLWKTNFLLRRVTYITYRRKDKIVRTFADCYWLSSQTTQRSFYSDTFTGRLLLFSVAEFSPVHSRLVSVSTFDRERDIGTGGILKEESEASNENKSTETECLTFSCEYLSSNIFRYFSCTKEMSMNKICIHGFSEINIFKYESGKFPQHGI